MPAIAAATETIVAVKNQRAIAASAYPAMIPRRRGEASSSRRPKPDSKSPAAAKPVNTPPKAADCRKTKTNWNAV